MGRRQSEERDETDSSLRGEREKTDVELARRHDAIQQAADASVDDARANADDQVRAARVASDDIALDAPGRAEVAAERRREDQALAEERAAVDSRLTLERIAHHRVIAQLLTDEREATDANLDVERGASDQAIDARDDFLGMVSHDVRTLLASLALNATLIHGEAVERGDGPTIARRAVSMQRVVTRMTHLIGDLMDVVSIEAGHLRVTRAPLDASRLLTETKETFLAPATARGIALEVKTSDDALVATCDHDRILQVLGNLVANAIKFTERGGRIDVDASARNDEVVFSVRDTGAGIRTDDLPHIFDRFRQAGPRKRQGLGLGLYIARCIVDAHGGRIWATSEPGKGSTLSFTLPRGA
jgi:signal transduction histidine kinase